MMALISTGLWLMNSEILYAALFGGLFLAFFNGSTETLVPAIVGDEIQVDMIPRTLGVIYIGADLGAMLGPIISLAVIDAGLLSVSQLYLSCIGLLAISTLVSLITSARENIRV